VIHLTRRMATKEHINVTAIAPGAKKAAETVSGRSGKK
jgi:hypothetical protein